jgi:hypothetical protein
MRGWLEMAFSITSSLERVLLEAGLPDTVAEPFRWRSQAGGSLG